ncbi:unnamed protein product, partial [Scytosiphon promiscuus]
GDRQPAPVSSLPRMESPVRSVETGENGGGGGGAGAAAKDQQQSAGAGATGGAGAADTSPSQRFEAKSYLERQVEELACADEDEAQEKVSKRLQFKQEQAQKKRDVQLQRRRKGIAERLRKIGEAREAVDARFAENAAQLMERQAEKQTRRTSLENIKKARAIHNRRVNQRRRESFDDASGVSPARIKGMHEFESKLARAERNRDNLRRERRRRAMERYEEGKARSTYVEAGRDNRRRQATEARQAAKARRTQRMRSLRQRMLSHSSRVSELNTRVFAASLLQEWWRCVRAGKSFDVADLAISSPDGTPLQRSPLGSPAAWATARGLGLSVPDIGFGSMVGPGGDAARNHSAAGGNPGGPRPLSPPVLDPCTRSPITTSGRFSPGVGGSKKALGGVGTAGSGDAAAGGGGGGGGGGMGDGGSGVSAMNVAAMGYGFLSHHKAALTIQAFLRRNMHPLKVANALLAGRLSIKVLCAATALKALRMGREMRSVPQTVRSARAFLSALLVNFFPTSALDDEGALSSSPEGTAPLKVEKERLVRAAGNAIQALLDLETTIDAAVAATGSATGGGATAGGGNGTETFGPEHFPRIRRASATMVRARVAFCRRFAEWKRKDAVRLADEMTAASVDVLFMQLRAERDLHVAAVRYGIDEADDGGALFSTGFEQIKEGTQRQLGKMMHALGKLVGADEARQRMDEATDAARSSVAMSEEEDDIAGPRRPLSAGDLLSNEWLVHEVMISGETLTVSLEEATVERHVAAQDYTPLLGLVAELRDKIIGLTPRRRDLAAETCEAMDCPRITPDNLTKPDNKIDAPTTPQGCFFRMVAFAGERVLELEAPIRNDATKATLAGWGRTQDEVEGGRRRLEPAMVRECFEKKRITQRTDEIHVDILNAHLQFVTPFLKQHGVEYERDRFTEKLDAGEVSLDMTHLWLHRAIRQLRAAAGVAAAPSAAAAANADATPPPPPASPEVVFYRQLLKDLDQRRGDAYLKLLRVAIVDNLLGSIVCVERKVGSS